VSALAAAVETFSRSPGWGWYAVGYFFLGGLAAGLAVLGAAADLFGGQEHRAAARRAYRLAVPLLLAGSALLILDLTRPERFWHMLVRRTDGMPTFKPLSPMSVGAWALAAFGAGLGALAFGPTLRDGAARRVVVATTAGLGFFVASYTGVLLASTHRPLWAETHWMGFLFLVSSASTAAALLAWASARSGEDALPSVAWLARFEVVVLWIEVCAIVALLASLGPAARMFASPWGVLLAAGVLGLGIVLPLLLHRLRRAPALAASLVLVGGLLLRVVVVFSSETL
jgi:formate-dependent nitrite reductase membrane component NrfD